MTLEQLRIFVVAEHEHVTRASYELDMVQSAVSKVIATLEGELAIRLFHRAGRTIKLTPRGAAFCNKAIELIDHADRLPAMPTTNVMVDRSRLKPAGRGRSQSATLRPEN